jgi:polygalacturonase
VTADNVTLKNFTLKSPLTNADGYGIHTSGCNNVIFENLLIENSGRSGVDFIGCNNIKINNLEAKNNGGEGMQ